jgi:hypothetical protein
VETVTRWREVKGDVVAFILIQIALMCLYSGIYRLLTVMWSHAP